MFIGKLWLVTDYFADHVVYDEKAFRRRLRMPRQVFIGIVEGGVYDDYF